MFIETKETINFKHWHTNIQHCIVIVVRIYNIKLLWFIFIYMKCTWIITYSLKYLLLYKCSAISNWMITCFRNNRSLLSETYIFKSLHYVREKYLFLELEWNAAVFIGFIILITQMFNCNFCLCIIQFVLYHINKQRSLKL